MGLKGRIADRLQKNRNQDYKLVRCYIADIDIDPDTGVRTIYLNEYGSTPEPPYIIADTPSFTAVEPTGGGVQSSPPKGSHCLAYIPVAGNTYMDKAQILTFLPDLGVLPEGSLSAEPVEQGSFYLKVGGRAKNIFKMTKEGVMSLYAGSFARTDISGPRQLLDQAFKRSRLRTAVGIVQNEYIEFDPLTNPGIMERTSHTSSFTHKQEAQIDSDQKMDSEEVAIVPLTTPYVNKAVVRAGKIHNTAQVYEDLATHSYVIDTRNSTGVNPMQKDAVTKLELGFQGGHYPGAGTDFRSPGNLIHWTAKRNVPGNVGSFLWRYGALENDHGTKLPLAPGSSVIPSHPVKGEVWRRQIHQGLQVNVPLGVPVLDPLGRGKGYTEGDGDTSLESYTESLGVLNSLLVLGQPTYKSFARKHMHATSVPGTGTFVDEHYGGEALPTDPDMYVRTIEEQLGFVPQKTFYERVGTNAAKFGVNYLMEVSDVMQNKHTFEMSNQAMKLESFVTTGVDTGSLVTDHTAFTTTLNHTTAGSSSFLELGALASSLQTMNGTTKIEADATSMTLSAAGGAVSITLSGTPPKITFTAGTLEFTVDSVNGVQAGGVSMANAKFVDWMLQNAGMISIGAMGPNVLSPGALAGLTPGAVPNAGGLVPTSFKTGI
tara:strand:+ start:7331 stop:9301 length:1971 start_codon:yes stop_codon:yes gene_type:complete